jgi:hypothetical protein
MSCDETKYYLRKKLSAAGSETPERVFPNSVCVELWEASGGWPGVLDRIALLALARAEKLPVTAASIERPALPDDTVDCSVAESESIVELPPAPPKLFVSKDGETIRELSFEQPRLLVGRSEHNDIAIPSKFVSRHHLMLVRHSTSTFVMDLNSSNGTYVNSKRIPHAVSRVALNEAQFADTAVMKTLDDMRMLLDHENTVMLPIATENLPTYNKQ